MTNYLEQITALGELHGKQDSPVSLNNYNKVEQAAYLAGYERGQWFADYELGWEAAIYNIELMLGSSEAYIAGYKSSKDYHKQYEQNS
jgi:hypothetical protein